MCAEEKKMITMCVRIVVAFNTEGNFFICCCMEMGVPVVCGIPIALVVLVLLHCCSLRRSLGDESCSGPPVAHPHDLGTL